MPYALACAAAVLSSLASRIDRATLTRGNQPVSLMSVLRVHGAVGTLSTLHAMHAAACSEANNCLAAPTVLSSIQLLGGITWEREHSVCN